MAVTGAASNVMLRASKTGISNELPSASVKRTLPLSSSVSTFWKSVLAHVVGQHGFAVLACEPFAVDRPETLGVDAHCGGTPPTGIISPAVSSSHS